MTLAVISVAALLTAIAVSLPAPAGRFPVIAGLITIVAASAHLLSNLKETPDAPGASSAAAAPSEARTLLWTASLPAATYFLGLPLALPLFTALYWRLRDHASWRASLVAGLAIFALVTGVLGFGLQVDLYPGWLGRWLNP
ncbi:MAG: hypothetical protein J0L64_11775 [Acidobacteria bacterium]|nr:hypothetical protein [Acidobacteriota bacterium]